MQGQIPGTGGVRRIEKTLFQFIWKYSRRDQFILLAFTCTLFPFLFLTLELPKRIINDAIGSQTSQISLLGMTLDQVSYLWVLCGVFLLAVLCHGLLKMRINTMKGVLSERMLRRLRYGLIARMMRFPRPYFQRTSQGELVAMITGETEPMGGMMGDALTQPVLQAGQMLTILFFLFLQSVWFGLAAVALIPLQAWLIPRLQRQINLMNKKRIREVRTLAALIGESAAGASDLRAHGGWRYRLAMITDRLGVVYRIRFQIYQKKFFMKFINNFITQLTPFFFFAIGGYLVIQGAVSLGALVAALAAYKDLSSPWKELLTYYNQAQDMSLRWETVMERFSPSGVIPEALMSGTPATLPRLDGAVELNAVTVTDADGNTVLDGVSAQFPKGSVVGIAAASEQDRRALADVLIREVIPVGGDITVAGHPLSELHQLVLSARIGHAGARPVLFQGSFGDNVMTALRATPGSASDPDAERLAREAVLAGNSPDILGTDWLDPEVAGLSSTDELREWWLTLVDATGSGDMLFRRSLDQVLTGEEQAELLTGIIAARPAIRDAVKAAGLDKHVYPFDRDTYNPSLTVVGNLFFASPRRPMSQAELADQSELFDLLSKLKLEESLLRLAFEIVDLLNQTFGTDGTEHPLFRKLGLDPSLYEQAVQIRRRQRSRPTIQLPDAEKRLLMSLPAQITAEQIGPAFPEQIRREVLEGRKGISGPVLDALTDLYAPLDPAHAAPGLTVLENALFGRISEAAGARSDELRRIVSDALEAAGLRPQVMQLIFDLPLGLNGGNLPTVFAEPLALCRAAIKKPDILVLEQTLAGFDQSVRIEMHRNLRRLLPDTMLIYLSDSFETPDIFDVHLEVVQGRLVTDGAAEESSAETAAGADLMRKVRALEATDMFSGLSRRQLRLLAFGARWYGAAPGETIFTKNDDPVDGAYMVLSGTAGLYNPQEDGSEDLVAEVGPGQLVGELGLIRNVPRALTMRATSEFEALRLGTEEFLAVVENDAATSFRLLQVVAGYTS
ncbi:ABC transporter transmembrane domain-containing protein [uncultured Roseobacter sp.]|uniref:ABC transporter transmembrane domain-containing protein n=1 Tax=uncultured Roseobacter sp. TaxID=114847 RepID=UPI00261BD047|nr:ABC transporter transmembrane domain-containing protein [uncultured Roseobacter sp.]